MKIAKSVFRKKNIKWFILLFLVILYIIFYSYQYINAVKPDIRYYEKGTKVENGGLEYEINAKIYSLEEFMEEFDLEKYEIACASNEYDVKMIVVDKKITRLNEEINLDVNSERLMSIYSKYWKVGYDLDLTSQIQKETLIDFQELEIGESTSRYQVFTIASCNLHKELWEDTDNTEVYFEFTDNEYYNYVRRIKVLN